MYGSPPISVSPLIDIFGRKPYNVSTCFGLEESEMQREHLGSRLGFILLSAGCAIGIGNVWKFPYVTGQNGGAIFVLIYLVCLVVLGLPVMTMEFAMGRGAQKSPVKMYQQLQPKGSKWYIHGYVALAGNILPAIVTSALSVAIYGMFIAIVVPEMKSSRPTAVCVGIAVALSCGFYFIPVLKSVPSGFVIIICACIASAIMAIAAPVEVEQ